MLIGAGYGVLERVMGGDWPSAALVAGMACTTALLTLYVLHLVTRVIAQAVKIVIPAAIVLAIGIWLDWEWAKVVTDALWGLWLASVEQIQTFWSKPV